MSARSSLSSARPSRVFRRAPAAVEVGAAALGHAHRPRDHGVSLPARYEQVEQDRAPALLLHRDELAGHPTRKRRDDRQPDRRDAESVETPHSITAGSRTLPQWRDRDRCATCHRAPRTASLSRRLELHDSPCYYTVTSSTCFLTAPNSLALRVASEPASSSELPHGNFVR
jgi:hypothetical protein